MELNTPVNNSVAPELSPPEAQQESFTSNQKKIWIGLSILAVVLFFTLVAGGYWVGRSRAAQLLTNLEQLSPTQALNSVTELSEIQNQDSQNQSTEQKVEPHVRWETTGDSTWLLLQGTAPQCPEPYTMQSPVDVYKASAILPPGQERQGDFTGPGGNYKPHGGFRFDGLQPNQVQVVSPISGYVYRGGNYLANGEVQYTFDIIDPCGVMVRVGHLKELSERFQELIASLPTPQEGDSRTQRFTNFPEVKAGEVIATAVGFDKGQSGPNVFVDLGVFDLRTQNKASQNIDFQQKQKSTKELSWYGVCWYNMLPEVDKQRIQALPAGDAQSGKKSDYCN